MISIASGIGEITGRYKDDAGTIPADRGAVGLVRTGGWSDQFDFTTVISYAYRAGGKAERLVLIGDESAVRVDGGIDGEGQAIRIFNHSYDSTQMYVI